MIEGLLLALGLIAGIDWRVLSLLGVVFWSPVIALLGLVVHIFRNRPGPSMRTAVFCQSVARELRAGAALRGALGNAAASVDATSVLQLLQAGETFDIIVPVLTTEFSEVGLELGTVVDSVATSGAASAPLFEELGDLALAQMEMAEEIRVATAPARASALVLVGLPMLYLGYQLHSGRIGDLLSQPVQQGLTLVGWALALAGMAVSYLIVRKTR